MTRISRFFLAALVVLVLLVALTDAHANSAPPVGINPSGSTTWPSILAQGGGQAVAATIVGGKPAAVIQATGNAVVAGKQFPVTGSINFTASAAGKAFNAAAKAGAKAFLPVVVAEAVHAAYCELSPGGFLCDPGEPLQPLERWCVGSSTTQCGTNPTAVADAFVINPSVSGWVRSWGSGVSIVTVGGTSCTVSGGSASCTGGLVKAMSPDGKTLFGSIQFGATLTRRVVPSCVEDAAVIPGTDLCTSNKPKTEPTDAEAEKRLIPAFEKDVPGMVRDILEKSPQSLVPHGSPQTLSGPPKTVGEPVTTTTTKPDGTVETKTVTPTYNHTYNGTTIITNTTYKTVYGDGTIVEEDKPEDPTPPAVDPDMPPVPDLYEQKYPDGFAGVWNQRKAELDQTPIFSFIDAITPDLPDGGCPQWQLPVMIGWNQWQTFDLSVPCWVWSAARVILLCTCLLLCRRLVFGG